MYIIALPCFLTFLFCLKGYSKTLKVIRLNHPNPERQMKTTKQIEKLL